jgi:hypothetical protein
MADLDAVHDRLRAIVRSNGKGLAVTKDTPEGITVEVPGLEGKPWGYVAGTRLGKRYVSFYLMPVYASPELNRSVSPALRKRMQGKSCFNFTTIDEALFRELADLSARGIPGFREVAEAVDAERSARR